MTVQGPEQWYIVDAAVVDGTLRSGPFDPDQLRNELLSGRFPDDSLVMRGRTGEAISVAAVLALIGTAAPAPPTSHERPSRAAPDSSVGRTVPDAPPARAVALRPLLIGASIALILSVAIPRVAGASAGVHFAWEKVARDPAGVLCAPIAGALALAVTLWQKSARVRGIVALLAGLAPVVVGALARRIGNTEALLFAGTLAFATAVLTTRTRWAPLSLRLAPLAGSALIAAAYLIPAAGRMPIRRVIDLLLGRSLAMGGDPRLAAAVLLLPLAATIFGSAYVAASAARRVALGVLPAHVVLAAPPLLLAGIGLVSLLDQRPAWVAWWQTAAQVGGALYLVSAGATSAIAAPRD